MIGRLLARLLGIDPPAPVSSWSCGTCGLSIADVDAAAVLRAATHHTDTTGHGVR